MSTATKQNITATTKLYCLHNNEFDGYHYLNNFLGGQSAGDFVACIDKSDLDSEYARMIESVTDNSDIVLSAGEAEELLEQNGSRFLEVKEFTIESALSEILRLAEEESEYNN